VAGPRFDEVEIGDDLPEVRPDVSLDRVKLFVTHARMSASRFTDHEQARTEGLPGAIVPGIMSQGILAALIHRWAPGSDVLKVDTVFRAPILTDSSPVCRGVVTDIDPEARTLVIDLTIENEAGETRVMGTASVRLAERS
jgi:acyl dehydratase